MVVVVVVVVTVVVAIVIVVVIVFGVRIAVSFFVHEIAAEAPACKRAVAVIFLRVHRRARRRLRR